MRKAFLIHSISRFKGWETCFRYMMEKCDTFSIIFQGSSDVLDEDEGGLNAGKREFLDLPAITISPYKGMENSIEVTGELNTVAREIFLTHMAPSFEGHTSDLWSFQFLKEDNAMMRVEDFTVALLFLEESEREDLLAQGVDGINLQEIDNYPNQ
jgi:hypothetical protein